MRRATWLLWLMLALLPLRSWAVASMGLPASDAAPAAVMASEMAAEIGSSGQPPCHDVAGDVGAGAACQACDWCHGAIVLPAEWAFAADDLPAAPPCVGPARDTGRHMPGGLDRPPRSHLA
jgi:hypothetical protein